jgi:beta-glucosidase
MAYLPGPWGGLPIAEVISGTVNPSGRLPMTYPNGLGDVGANYYRSGIDPYKPLFPFSAGLSYSTVEYSGLKLNHDELHTTTSDEDENTELNVPVEESNENEPEAEVVEDENTLDEQQLQKRHHRHQKRANSRQRPAATAPSSIRATIRVKNTSNRSVKETVFWYITQDYRSDIMPEAYMLRGFEKVALKAGESKEVKFSIRRSSLAYHDRDMKKKVEKGVFTLTVNAMRPEQSSIKFTVV